MKIVGLIVEYNPLHTGHVYHFNKVVEESNADLIITIISSSLTMRGELSVFNKFIKTKQALALKSDIVIELPGLLAINNADLFSKYAIMFLNNLKVNEIWIGSENNDNLSYEKYYNIMKSNEYNSLLNSNLKNGNSYKSSSILALEQLGQNELKSNDILGLSYYTAIKDLNYSIELKTIKRVGNDYNDINLSNSFSSAKSIRTMNDNFLDFLPSFVKEDYNNLGFLMEDKIFSYLKYQILSLDINQLKEIAFISDGIENKLKEILKFNNYLDFITHMKNKRFTISKIKRICLSILFGIKKSDKIITDDQISFVRVLGYNIQGQKYLNSIKKDIKIYTNIKENINSILDFEIKISKILDTIYNLELFKQEQKGPIKI